MLVSILVPIYKVEKHITKCLGSIFNQTYTDIEYVFVDDCTPDNSMLLLNDYINNNQIDRGRITIISHHQNQGIAVTRNDCIANAKGEYVLFVDSDDWIEHDMVERLVNATDGGKFEIVGCDYIKEYIDGSHTEHIEDYAFSCYDNMIKCINYDIATALWKLLIKRTLFSNVFFQPDIEIGEDYIASIKLYYYAKSFSCVHKYLYHYVQYNESRYSNMIAKSIQDHVKIVMETEKFLISVGLLNDARIRNELNKRKFAIKRYYLSKPLLDFKQWKKTFPEANKMWRHMNYTNREKLKFWLAEKYWFYVIRMFQ